MNWKPFLIELTELPQAKASKMDVTLFTALGEDSVSDWETRHEVRLPQSLRSFYLQSNGMEAQNGKWQPVMPLADCDLLPQGCELAEPWLEFGRSVSHRYFTKLEEPGSIYCVEHLGSEPEFFAQKLEDYFRNVFTGDAASVKPGHH
ncbi:MAG: SMI1/KNR4 family protein [Verrucomicrobiota bacterium]